MNKFSVLGMALALTLGATGGALAQGFNPDQRGGPQNNRDCRNGPDCAGPDQHRGPGQNAGRPNQPQPQQQGRDNPGRNDWQQNYHAAGPDDRGAGPDHAFRRGGRLPPEFHDRRYVVNDWRGHHLSAPPRGYHWVQNGSDYLLVAITTGVIMQILMNN